MRRIAGFNVEFERFEEELYDGTIDIWYMFIARDKNGREWAEHYNHFDNMVENVDTARDSQMLENFTEEEDYNLEHGINEILKKLAIENPNNGTVTAVDLKTGKIIYYFYQVDSLEEAEPMIKVISDYFNR